MKWSLEFELRVDGEAERDRVDEKDRSVETEGGGLKGCGWRGVIEQQKAE